MHPTAAGLSLDWLLGVLSRRGLIDQDQLQDIRVRSAAQRARLTKQLGSVWSGEGGHASAISYQVNPVELVASFGLEGSQGLVLDEDQLARVVAQETGLTWHKIDPLKLDVDLITRTVSRPFAMRHVVLPLARRNDALVLAICDPFDLEVLENIKRITQTPVHPVVSSKRDIIKAIVEVYGFRHSVESAAREVSSELLPDFEQLVRLRSVGEIEANDEHIVNAVDFLLRYAFDQRASDIHIEPRRSESQVRLRIDGILHTVRTVPRTVHPAITSRLKTIARMDIAEKRRPQDGRIKTEIGSQEVELRVSTLPTAFGEKTVLRIFDPDVLLRDLSDLGFDSSDLTTFESWIQKPHGMILITGPTGSGKTTTLYTTLKSLARETVNITTVEDPIEMVTDHFNQVAVQAKIGVDFASALRSILRQDPDIIMVGEIRDLSTAEMAVQAALTGHLVFSTLHTNDTVGAITRLSDLGMARFLISSTVVGVMAQRLLRRVCEKCAAPSALSADQAASLGVGAAEEERFRGTMAGKGCVACRGTGYLGRVGIFELLDMKAQWSQLVADGAGEAALRSAALTSGMRTLRQCAISRLEQGATSFEEVMRVVGPAA